jgi:TRAP transporter TAXI family solute receptor
MFGRRKLLAAAPALALAPYIVSGAPGGARAEQSKLLLGTASEGGGFIIYSLALLDALRLADPTLELKTKETGGSKDNVTLLQAGDIDFGMVSGEVTHELLNGEESAKNKLSVVTVIAPVPGMFAVRSGTRYRRIEDLKGRPIVWNTRASGLVVQARYVMSGLGLDMDQDFEPIYPERFNDGPPLVASGQAAALWGSGMRWPGFVQLADSTLGCRFVPPDADEIARIRDKYPFLSEITIPGGQYRGQYDPIRTVGTWSFILARPELEDSLGYRMAADLHKIQKMQGLTKHIVGTTAKNTLAAIPGLEVLQPGVARYYKEAGFIK